MEICRIPFNEWLISILQIVEKHYPLENILFYCSILFYSIRLKKNPKEIIKKIIESILFDSILFYCFILYFIIIILLIYRNRI